MAENTQQNLENQDNNELSGKDLHDIVLKQYELLNNQSHTIRQLQIDKDEMGEEFSITKILSIFKRDKEKNQDKDNEKKSRFAIPGSFIGRAVINFLKFLYSNKTPVLICTILGLIAGIVVYVVSEKVYASTIVFSSGVLTNDFYKSHAEVLSDAAEYSPESLAKILNISEDMAEKIVSISFDEYEGYQKQRLEIVNDSTNEYVTYSPFFSLTFGVTDGTIMDEVEKGTFNYFDNNSFTKRQLERNLEIIEAQIQDVEKNQLVTDSINTAISQKLIKQTQQDQYFIKETGINGNGIILSQEDQPDKLLHTIFDINNIYASKRHTLNERKSRLEKDKLAIVSSHTSGFRPLFPRIRHIILLTFLGFLLGTVIAFIIMVLKGLKSFLEKADKAEKENK